VVDEEDSAAEVEAEEEGEAGGIPGMAKERKWIRMNRLEVAEMDMGWSSMMEATTDAGRGVLREEGTEVGVGTEIGIGGTESGKGTGIETGTGVGIGIGGETMGIEIDGGMTGMTETATGEGMTKTGTGDGISLLLFYVRRTEMNIPRTVMHSWYYTQKDSHYCIQELFAATYLSSINRSLELIDLLARFALAHTFHVLHLHPLLLLKDGEESLLLLGSGLVPGSPVFGVVEVFPVTWDSLELGFRGLGGSTGYAIPFLNGGGRVILGGDNVFGFR